MSVLNRDILSLIFAWLDLVSLGRASRTCHEFNRIASGNNFLLWKKFAVWHMKNDVYNWKTIIRAYRIERSLLIENYDQMFVSPRYGRLEVRAYDMDNICQIYPDHETVASLIVNRYNGARKYGGYVIIDDRSDVDEMLADLITNYGFYQIF